MIGTRPLALDELRPRVVAFCRRHRVSRLEVFGSIAKGEGRPDSDLDLLITFKPDVHLGLDFFGLQDELEQQLGCRVDLRTRPSVEQDANSIRRQSILESAHEIYAA